MQACWTSLPVELRALVASKTNTDADAASLHLADNHKCPETSCLFTQPRDAADAHFLEELGRQLHDMRDVSRDGVQHVCIRPVRPTPRGRRVACDGDVNYHIAKLSLVRHHRYLIISNRMFKLPRNKLYWNFCLEQPIMADSAKAVVNFFAGASRRSRMESKVVDSGAGWFE